jgi:two-component system LytT family sensor kinase
VPKSLHRAPNRTLPVFMHPLVFVMGSALLGVLFALQNWISVRRMNVHVGLPLLLEAWCVEYLLWGSLCWLSWRWLGPWLPRASAFWMVVGVLPLSVAMSILEKVIWVLCFPNLPLGGSRMGFWERVTFQLKAELIDGVVIFWCAFALFRGVGYYQRFREKEDAAAQLEVQLAQAQLHALRMNLNPHFLFNTLNSISSLMRSDVASADIMLEQLSSLLRIVLERREVQMIPLCDEIEFVEMYLAMQDRRFGGRILQEIRIDPELHDALVPAMILQPIIENAYRHGLSRLEGEGVLLIDARRETSRIKISVLNSGVGLNPQPSESPNHQGLGLVNVTDRLRLHYREDHTFSMREVQQGMVEVTMTLPLQLCSNPQKSYQIMEHDDSFDDRR